MRWIRKPLDFFGVDHAIGWTLAGRLWSALAGPVGLWLIGTRLSREQQGLYYLFADVAALKVVVELGASYVIMQVVSHEKTTLDASGIPQGSPFAQARVGAILRLASGYYAVAALAIALPLATVGSWFIGLHTSLPRDTWLAPWILLVATQSAAMIPLPFLATMEGLDAVHAVARVRVVESAILTLAIWGVLVCGGGLYAQPIGGTAALAWILGWLLFLRRRTLLALWRARHGNISWLREIWPFQWRIAISWICGYFIFQLFTPVVYALEGAEEAGRMGMSMAIMTAILSLGLAWVMTKAPKFGQLISQKDWAGLDALFFPAVRRGAAIVVLGATAAVALGPILHVAYPPMEGRILGLLPMAVLSTATLATYVIVSLAIYMRAHREEPFLANACVNAILIMTLGPLAAAKWGTPGICWVYLAVQCCIVLPWALGLFRGYRKRHEATAQEP